MPAKGDQAMLLTRKAAYGLIAVKHLAEQPRENSFSAKDLPDLYGFPQEALAKTLQRLATAGLLPSHHGIKGGYALARDPTVTMLGDAEGTASKGMWIAADGCCEQRVLPADVRVGAKPKYASRSK
jgi:hypothetical protein